MPCPNPRHERNPWCHIRRHRAIGPCLILMLLAPAALCGPMPKPLEADLDLAQRVVVGKIIALEPAEKSGDFVKWATATIEVQRTLKGEPQPTVNCLVATEVQNGMAMASPPRVHRVDDDGIWLILPDGDLSHVYGLLEEKDEPVVKGFLAELEHRTWSEPVNGLRAWSKATVREYMPKGSPPVIIFAVQNVTDHVIYCPKATENVVRLSAVDADGVLRIVREDDRLWNTGRIYCQPLQPGQIEYLHRSYSYIDAGRLLPPGKYTLTVTLFNQRAQGQWSRRTDFREDVTAWTGEVSAPAIVIDLPAVRR